MQHGGFGLRLDAGALLRSTVALPAGEYGSELPVGAAVRQRVPTYRAVLFGELLLASGLAELMSTNGTALEGQFGAGICVANGAEALLAGGGGLLRGLGSTSMRVTLGVRLGGAACRPPPVPDRDGDGIPDDKDACPDVPGVSDPDPGRNGCPPDRDGDRIPDDNDACPDVPGVAHDDPKRNGCPPDRDGDSIPDATDACPDTPGVAHDDPKRNGCPADSDDDGIPDAEDACPKVAGVPSEHAKLHGCPPPKIEKKRIEFDQRIEFEVDRARITAEWRPLLDPIADLLRANPQLTVISVEGHTDATHTPEHNLVLSRRRAAACVDYLVSKGIARKRLRSKGFGQTRPVASNDTDEGRQRNRRVEFNILSRSDEP